MRGEDVDACTSGVVASLYSRAAHGVYKQSGRGTASGVPTGGSRVRGPCPRVIQINGRIVGFEEVEVRWA